MNMERSYETTGQDWTNHLSHGVSGIGMIYLVAVLSSPPTRPYCDRRSKMWSIYSPCWDAILTKPGNRLFGRLSATITAFKSFRQTFYAKD